MVKVNFKKFKVFTNLKKTQSIERDFQGDLAEFVYGNGGGFKACRLANKIADGKNGEVELIDEEVQMVLAICDNSNMRCDFLTSLHDLLDPKEEKSINSKK